MVSIPKKSFVFCTFMLLLSLCAYIIYDFYFFTESVESCRSNLVITNSEYNIKSIVIFHFFKNSGAVELYGFYTTNQGHIKKINRKVTFNLVERGDKYTISETNIIIRDNAYEVNALDDGLLPDLFVHKKSSLILEKRQSGNGEKVFLWSGLPFLYCFRE
ncbi:hypothetical protein [Klebsiella aerogenes]|uniref:hypothetical protein n=1 Tax=Klebsiella aerogenes TaxID=548 RepID=UPI000AA9D730|nr:hypothetical protein [Klebsiella aerogenes]